MKPLLCALPLAFLAACQLPGRAPENVEFAAAVDQDDVVLSWDSSLTKIGRTTVVPVRVYGDRPDQPGTAVAVEGSTRRTSTDDFEPGTWRFRLQVRDEQGSLLVDELSPEVHIRSDYPALSFLGPEDFGFERRFGVPSLVAVPSWHGLLGAYDADVLRDARIELLRTTRACVEASLGAAYVADLDELERVERARDTLAPRGGDCELLTHALSAKTVVVFDLRMPKPDVPAQLVMRVFDVTYRRYDQELLKLLNRRPMVFEDYVELEFVPGADNSGRIVAAYAALCESLRSDALVTDYFERLGAGGDELLVDDSAQDALLRALGRKLPEAQEGDGSNHAQIEQELLFPRIAAEFAPAPAVETPVYQPAIEHTEPTQGDDLNDPAAPDDPAALEPAPARASEPAEEEPEDRR